MRETAGPPSVWHPRRIRAVTWVCYTIRPGVPLCGLIGDVIRSSTGVPVRRRHRLVELAIGAFAAASATAHAQIRNPSAKVGGATYVGRSTDRVAVFKGIPYAKPPVGDLRWRPPVPNEPTGEVQAMSFSAQCVQTDRLFLWARNIAKVFGTEEKVAKPLPTSEDCLYLNVWSPKLTGAAPVMVWIHGGSNTSGTGSDAMYDGTELAKRGVVVVTINYRLGVFGFLVHPALMAESPQHAAGNYAILDQIEALKWVRAHIAAFGGDPSRVTIFGESAGSIDIVHLMASPLAKGLFHRAIAESGAPMARMPNADVAGAFGARFAKALGVDSAGDVLAQMRRKSADDVLKVYDDMPGVTLMSGPTVDGWLFRDMTARVFERGEQADVPLLIGSNALEMTTLRAYIPAFPRTPAGYRMWASTALGVHTDSILQFYPATENTDVEGAVLHLMTEMFMTCPVRMATRFTAQTGRPTYRYYFTRVMPGAESLGAYHASEIGYVFGVKLPWLPTSAADEKLSNAMMGYWTRFAATGDPNGAEAPKWPRVQGVDDAYLELGDSIVARAGLKKGECDALEAPLRAPFSAGK